MMFAAELTPLNSDALSRHLGLINTMVFTHLPSSAAVLFFPLPPTLIPTMLLLFVRTGLNSLDQAPRTAFIAAVVKPEERTAVMGITSTLRTLAMATGPSLTGGLAESGKFWIAFVVGGVLRIMYDLGLWFMFINMRLHSHEGPEQETAVRGQSIDEQDVEPARAHAEQRAGDEREHMVERQSAHGRDLPRRRLLRERWLQPRF